MSDQNSSNSGEIVRGNGHAPGQTLGVPMPSVTTNERGGLDDFERTMRAKNEEADRAARERVQGQQRGQTSKGRIAEFQQKLDDRTAQLRGEAQPPADPEPEETPESAPSAEPEQPEQDKQQAQPENDNDEASPLDDKQALEKFREWDKSDLFPQELENKWLTEVKPNGNVQYVTHSELKRGYLRGIDWARMGEQHKQMQTQLQGYEAERQQHFEAIRDPQKMLEIYERNGYSDTLYQVATLIAERDAQDRSIIRAAGLAEAQRLGYTPQNIHAADRDARVLAAIDRAKQGIARMRQVEIDARRVEYDRSQLQARQNAVQHETSVNQLSQQYTNQLNQLRPAALRAYGFRMNDANVAAFNRHLGKIIGIMGKLQSGITREMAMDAAKNLRDEQDEIRENEQRLASGNGNATMTPKEWRARQQAESRSQALPPGRRGAGNGQALGANGGQPQRGSLKDLEQMVRNNRMRG